MKIVPVLTTLICLALIANAQRVHIYNEKVNYLFVGIPNPINISLEGYKAKNLIVSVDNGEIQQDTLHPETFEITPKKVGRMKIVIKAKRGAGIQTIDSQYFSVREIPKPIAYLGNLHHGLVKTVSVRGQGYLLASSFWGEAQICARFNILSFKAIAIRNESLLFSISNTGTKLNEELAPKMLTLKPGDELIITHIKAKLPDGTIAELDPIEYQLED